MCGGSKLIAVSMVTFTGSSDRDKTRRDERLSPLGLPRSAFIVYGRVDICDTLGVLNACKSGLNSGYMPEWCRWKALLLCLSIGVCVSVCVSLCH